jgi:hypothetical protein
MQPVDGREERDDLVGQESRWSRLGLEREGSLDGVKEIDEARRGRLRTGAQALWTGGKAVGHGHSREMR